MTDLWPWLTAAGAGALHGLHPMGGWALGAALGLRRSQERKIPGRAFAASLALCALLALQDAGHSMAPLLWGLCTGLTTDTSLPGVAPWATAASLVAVHVAAWLAVSAALAVATVTGASRAAGAWRRHRSGAA